MYSQILEAKGHRASPEESSTGAESVRGRTVGREGRPLKGLKGK